jgi:beta-glucanase (GH16 family)
MQERGQKFVILFAWFTATAILLFSASGCSLYMFQNLADSAGTVAETGELVVTINNGEVKTLAPPISMTPASYNVSGSDGNGGSFNENTGESSVTIPNLAFGAWTVTVDVLNELGTLIGRGQNQVDVKPGQTSAVNVVVTELDGSGTLELSMFWPSADTQNPSVQATLIPPAGSQISLAFTIPAPGNAVCTQGNIPMGFYTLELQLLDNDIAVAGAAEIVRIVKDQTTSGTFEFTEINAPGGAVAVAISPEINDPIEVTLSGQLATLEAGSTMTVTASVPAYTATVSYTWYLNGLSRATGSSYTVSSVLSEGDYRLDVTVMTTDGSRAGSATHSFQVVAAAVAQDPPTPPDEQSEWVLSFQDEFTGTSLDTDKWTTGYWWDRDGSTNLSSGELQWYQPDDVLVEDGMLRLRAQERTISETWLGLSFDYTSGIVTTGRDTSDKTAPARFLFEYGYAEIRARVPRGQGLWPAFWLLPASHESRPEIDVLESLGHEPEVAHFNYHYLFEDGSRGDEGKTWTGPDFSADWHVFAVDWQPDVIIWYVDGIERWRFTEADRISSEPMYLLLNLAVGGDWAGAPDEYTIFPSYFEIDYVRVWERPR